MPSKKVTAVVARSGLILFKRKSSILPLSNEVASVSSIGDSKYTLDPAKQRRARPGRYKTGGFRVILRLNIRG
jgi:hypothetical protein